MTEKESKKTVDTTEEQVKDGKTKFEKVSGKKPSQLELARQEAAEYKDLALRRMAELENFRKNNINVAKDTRDRTIAEVITAILPAIDAFTRAEGMITDEKTKSGVGIIHDQLLNVLKRYGVTPIDAADKDFNPAEHECIMQVDSPDKVGKVIYEIEKGYNINGKVLRYTKVAVGKEVEAEENAESAESVETENE